MSDLDDLYQQVIIDHSRRPRNFRKMPEATHHLEGYNPLCGDKVTIYAKTENGIITDLSFQGSGCAISTASASMLTEQLKGKTATEVDTLFHHFHDLVTGLTPEGSPPEDLGKLTLFEGVREFPTRVKCASLAWHTLRAALQNKHEPVSTE